LPADKNKPRVDAAQLNQEDFMKNVKNVLFFLLAAAAAVAVLGGCDTSGIAFTNEMLLADGDGHFEKDLEYTLYNSLLWSGTTEKKVEKVWTYGADGSCSYTEYFYEETGDDINKDGTSGDGYVLFKGRKGTYTYDNDTYTLTETTSEVLSPDTGYQWADDIKTISSSLFLFENVRRDAYTLENGVLTHTTTETDPDLENKTGTVTFTLADDNKTLTSSWVSKVGDVTEWKGEWTYKVGAIHPSGKTLSTMDDGDVITFASNEETATVYYWDDTNEELVEYGKLTKYGQFDQSFMKVGEYFIGSPVELDRDLR
jgi:hypothetical protein